MASDDMEAFRTRLREARRITVLTGAGVSAESGVPTFRGAGGLWRRWAATDLATPAAWAKDAGLVWEFYDYRRRIMKDKQPNPGHVALARLEKRWREAGRELTLVTQNIDGLHELAGSEAVIRLHGSLWFTRCLGCERVVENRDVPITPAYEGAGDPDPEADSRRFTEEDLPRCSECGDVERPHVVWFGEGLDHDVLQSAADATAESDVFLVVGTSAMVHPAAGLIPLARRHGATVAEVNVEESAATHLVDFHFQGKAGEVLPGLLFVDPE